MTLNTFWEGIGTTSGFTREKYKHMAGYEKFLKDIGISFDWSKQRLQEIRI